MKHKVSFGILIAMVVGFCVFYYFRPTNKKIGMKVVEKVEKYKDSTRYYPRSLGDIGIEEKLEGPIFYDRKGDSYIVWYGTTLGESVTYYPERREWRP